MSIQLQIFANLEMRLDAEVANKLWQIKAPSKCLNLVWRALSNCLPTLTQLSMKHVLVQVGFPLCNIEVETTMHCLVTCQFAKQC